MKKLFLSMLGILALAGMLQAGDGRGMGSEHGHFMEPTQADYDCCYVTIAQQQANYEAAKAKGQFDGMVDYAMFHWVLAWVYNNEAHRIFLQADHTAADIDRGIELCGLADAQLHLSQSTDQTKACAKALKSNREWFETNKKQFETGSKK